MFWLALILKWWLIGTVGVGVPFCVFWALWRAREKRICKQRGI